MKWISFCRTLFQRKAWKSSVNPVHSHWTWLGVEAEQDKLRLTAGMFPTLWNLAHPPVRICSIYLIFLSKIPTPGILKGLELHQEVFRSSWHCDHPGTVGAECSVSSSSCSQLCWGFFVTKLNLRPGPSPFIFIVPLYVAVRHLEIFCLCGCLDLSRFGLCLKKHSALLF